MITFQQKKILMRIVFALLIVGIGYGTFVLYQTGRQIAIDQLTALLQKEIKKQNLNIKWKTMKLSLVPLKVHWEKVSMDITSAYLPQALTADSLSIRPDYLAVLKRKLLFKARAQNLSTQIHWSTFNLPSSQTKKTKPVKSRRFQKPSYLKFLSPVFKLPKKKDKLPFAFLEDVPLSQVELKNAHLLFISNQSPTAVKNADIILNLHPSAITMTSQIGLIKIHNRPAFSSALNTTITADKIKVPVFLLKNPSTDFKLSGWVTGDPLSLTLNAGQVKADGNFSTDDLNALIKTVFPDFANPFKGQALLKTELKYNKSDQWQGNVELKAMEFFANQVFLSEAKLKAQLKKQSLIIEDLKIGERKTWQIGIQKGHLSMKKPFAFQSQILVRNASLKHFFSDISLKNLPIYGNFSGVWKCQGQLFEIECEGKSALSNFTIAEDKNKLILKAPQLDIQSQLVFSNQTANIIAKLSGPDSHLDIQSSFNSQQGFTSQFEGKLNLSDLEDLIQLSPEGIAHIKNGSLAISNNKALIKADLTTQDLVLDDFYVGSANTQVSWTQKGILHFQKIKGRFKKSQYKGNVSIDIPKNSIRVFAHSPFITLQDLKEILKNHIYFPFSIKGKGQFNGYLHGPLQANILSYSLEAQLFDISWEGESFDTGLLKVESQKGYVKTKKALLTKGGGQINFEGAVDPKGNLKASLTGENLSVQSSENISQAFSHDLEGDLSFKMLVSGYFLKPFNETKIKVQNSFFKGYPVGDFVLDLNIYRQAILAKGMLTEKIKLYKLLFPYEKNGQVEIKADVKDLNIKELFFSKSDGSSLYNQFQSQIDGSFDLTYNKDKIVSSLTGFIKADRLSLKPPTGQLKNQGELFFNFNKGFVKIKPFSLVSSNQFLNFRQDKKIHIQGDLKLDFLIFLFPFMRAWEGDLKMSLNMMPQLFAPNLTGDLWLENGFIQLHDLVDPFEQAYLKAKIKNHRINISYLDTRFGGGELKGQGQLFWSPQKTLHVDMKADFKDVIFSSLPGFFVRGQGQLYLKGNQFPYTLGMNANVKDLRVEKEFQNGSSQSIQLNHRLVFLQESEKKNLSPLNFNLKLFPQNPIQVENSVMKASFKGDIQVIGSSENPLLTGTFKALPNGLVRFRDHDFNLQSARVQYKNASPANPVIDLSAQSSVQEEQGEGSSNRQTETDNFSNEYQVRLRVKGNGKNPRFNLSATPRLSEKEIVSLLAFGARSIKFEPGNPLNNITRYSYSQLGPALFQKAIGRELKNTLGVVDQFLIIPHISSKTSAPTTRLIVRKTMFNRLDLSSSYTLLNEERESDIKAKYKINKNVSLIGLWENESLIEGRDEESNTLGLNLEYQIDF